jgi:hypothetical protein
MADLRLTTQFARTRGRVSEIGAGLRELGHSELGVGDVESF